MPEIAARLQVAHIVEGSVRRAGEDVRITAQLIRADDGFHLWSQTYDRTLEHVFAVQEDIAESIANALDVVLDDSAREALRNSGIRDVDAFINYQKGLEAFAAAHESAENITESLVNANVYFELALEAAPDLAAARVLKADLASHIIFDFAAGRSVEAYPGQAEEALAAVREELDMAWRTSPPGNQRDVLDLERVMFLDDWRGVSAKAGKALRLGQCSELNWTTEFVAAFGWADEISEKYRELLVCDPVNFGANVFRAFLSIWRGAPADGLQMIADARSRGFEHPWLNDVHFLVLAAAGQFDDPVVQAPQPEISGMQFDRRIWLDAVSGNDAAARRLAEEHWAQPGADDWSSMIVAAVVGDRDRANEHAARMDARPGGPMALSSAVFNCYCGAPFDLDVTPNFKARIEEAGFPWPPRTRIDFPAKTW